jgi:quercetin dioxygenase-like cupin family protein
VGFVATLAGHPESTRQRRPTSDVRNWDVRSLPARPHAPEIPEGLGQTARVLSSSSDARAIMLHLAPDGRLQDHEVHERAWLVIIDGEVEIESDDIVVTGGPGFLTEFEPRERHEVRARSEARMLLLLTPWPGEGHPGAMSIAEKEHVRQRARERADSGAAGAASSTRARTP